MPHIVSSMQSAVAIVHNCGPQTIRRFKPGTDSDGLLVRLQGQLRWFAKDGRAAEVGALLGRPDMAQFIDAPDEKVRCGFKVPP